MARHSHSNPVRGRPACAGWWPSACGGAHACAGGDGGGRRCLWAVLAQRHHCDPVAGEGSLYRRSGRLPKPSMRVAGLCGPWVCEPSESGLSTNCLPTTELRVCPPTIAAITLAWAARIRPTVAQFTQVGQDDWTNWFHLPHLRIGLGRTRRTGTTAPSRARCRVRALWREARAYSSYDAAARVST